MNPSRVDVVKSFRSSSCRYAELLPCDATVRKLEIVKVLPNMDYPYLLSDGTFTSDYYIAERG